ncbi:MAG: uridine kinase [Peptococcaceae bacterium]|nr:uridine kinase [Peptococcaceae bacterium]
MPYIVGIAGGTGSGKSTLAENMIKHFTGQTLLIRHDNYYRDQSQLPMEMRVVQNYDHPAAFEDEVLIEHLEILRQGQVVWGPLYDFATHTRQSTRQCLEPRELIIVEGILALHHPALRQIYDLKVFVDTDADIRILRRLTRDLVERGRTMESVVEQYIATVKPMHEQYVEPSKRHADVIIPEGGLNNAAIALIAARLRHALHMGASARGGEVFC